MKTIKLFILLLPLFCFSQEKIKPLDINLTNYEYPYPVSFLELNNQRQDLKQLVQRPNPSWQRNHSGSVSRAAPHRSIHQAMLPRREEPEIQLSA